MSFLWAQLILPRLQRESNKRRNNAIGPRKRSSGLNVWQIGKWGVTAVLTLLFLLFEKLSLSIGLIGVASLTLLRQWSDRMGWTADGPAAAPNLTVVDARDEIDASVPLPSNVIPLNNAFAPAWKDIDDFFQATLDVIKTRFEFQTANIFLLDEDGETLVQRAYVTRTSSVARLAAIKVGQGLVGWVAAQRRPLLVANLHHEGRSMGYYRTGGETISSFAAVPILVKDQVVGVIALDHENTDAFPSPATENSLAAIAGLLARVLGSEETREQLTRSQDRLRESRRVVQAAYEAAGLDEAAAAVLKELVSLADLHSLSLYLLDEQKNPSRRADIGFNGIGAYHVKEPVIVRAVRQALHQCGPYRIEGAALAAQYRAAKARESMIPGALLALPILHRGEPLGALVVEAGDDKVLDERIEGILEDVASHLGGAFLRVYRSAMAEGTAKVEGELMQLLSTLLETDEPEQIWEKLSGILLERTGASGIAAFRKVDGGFQIESAAGCTVTADFVAENTTLIGWAALAGRPVLATASDRRQPPVQEGESYLAFAVGDADDCHSVILLVADEADHFTQERVEWVAALARTIPPLIRQVGKLEEARQALDRDPLTGLFNEHGFVRRLKALGKTSGAGLVMLRVDNNEALLAEYGRKETTFFLARLGNLLKTTVSHRGILARLDNGRFAIAFKENHEAEKNALLQLLHASTVIAMLHETPVSFSLTSVGLEENVRVEEMLDAAESRLANVETRETTVVSVA